MPSKLTPILLTPENGASPKDLEIMLKIYNDSREFFRQPPRPEVSWNEQLEWWKTLDHDTVKCFLYSDEDENIVAFSKITDLGLFSAIVFAVDEKFRGNKYGEFIVKHSMKIAGKPIAGTRVSTNKIIIHVHAKLGWQVLFSKEGMDYIFHKGPRHLSEDEYSTTRKAIKSWLNNRV